jgi:hypothetical protein
MNEEILNHYKNVHKMWNGKKWKLVYTALYDGEKSHIKSHIIDKVLDDTYAVFRFDIAEKLRRFSLWENSYEMEGKHYSYTREEEEFCYDGPHKKPYKFWFDWSYPYLTEILRDENGVKIMETQWQIMDDKDSQN